eukprot:gnl/Hemi2/5345_TR1849_c0_g1_i1.p1 gnl/Hemi2/5345_TR1849_c0_g1~~gnl/Hemi2/5345_TR1849_c0_g1_i1.p1  ORF type:complete len:538 (-),score=4.89 gnl/Hemi2/5345_TR1849_c0_g1_i1:204-1817(-)
MQREMAASAHDITAQTNASWLGVENDEEPSGAHPLRQRKDLVGGGERVYLPYDGGGFSFRRAWAFMGPGFLISIAYIDPGNFATNIQAGSGFSYSLLWVLLLSTGMGLLVQVLSANLGLVTERHLAQHCAFVYGDPPCLRKTLWFLTELAIIAGDTTTILGTAIGLQLLFDVPLVLGMLITVFDTFLLFGLQYFGMRKLEAFIGLMLIGISLCFVVELFFSKPPVLEVLKGFIPQLIVSAPCLYVAIGIVGSTVMPHNLYLHSALVQTREIDRSNSSIWEAIFYNVFESAIALFVAFGISASMIIVAAAALYGKEQGEPVDLTHVPKLLGHSLHSSVAPVVFGIALLCAGQSATITNTYAGQYVMEGFLDIPLSPWKRRLLTRGLAIVPTILITHFSSNSPTELIIFSQVVLSFQLPFALLPLIKLTSSPVLMGSFVNSCTTKCVSYLSSCIIILSNISLGCMQVIAWCNEEASSVNTWGGYVLLGCVIAGAIAYVSLLGFLLHFDVDSKTVLADWEDDERVGIVAQHDDDDGTFDM